jgi:HAD superfamily hydrolase (TIGR01509 family)
MIRAVIFDLDGTLLKTEQLKAQSYARAAVLLRPETLNEAEVTNAFEDFVGSSREEVSKGMLHRFGLEDAARLRMAEFGANEPWQVYTRLRLRIFEEILADETVLKNAAWPHNIDLLNRVRAEQCKLGLATMSYCPQVERSLRALGLESVFDFIATREDVENPKPDPEIYLLVAKALGVPPADCMVVEDSVAGVKAGLAAGGLVLAVATPLTRRKLHESGLLEEHDIVDDPAELYETMARLLAKHNAK